MSQIKNKFIEDDAVTTAKIADGSVTSDKMQNGSVAYFDTDHTLNPGWSANIPGLVFDGTTAEAQAAFATGIAFLGNGNQSYLTMATEQQTAGANPSADIDIYSGDITGAATGGSGGVFLYSGQGVSSSGGVQLNSGNASAGNSGEAQMRTGDASGATGTINIEVGNATAANSGDISLRIGTAGGTQGKFRFFKTGVPSVVGQVWTATGINGEGYWAAASGGTGEKETFTLSAGDITNQYIDLAQVAKVDSIHFIIKGGAPTLEGASHDYSVSYTGGVAGKTRISFLNDIATGGPSALIAGDIIQIVYLY